MTLEEQTLDRVIRMLERLDIPYMITGSLAASHHGRPRATHDADLVIDRDGEQLDALVRDRRYLAYWAEQLGVVDLWHTISDAE